MEEDIRYVIQKKIGIAEEKLKEARSLAGKAIKLSEDERKNIPTFLGDWSERGLSEFFEQIKESVKKPLKHKNRKLLEDNGVEVKGICEGILDDSESVEGIAENLKKVDKRIAKLIVEKEMINCWLIQGVPATLENLNEIIVAKGAFQCIMESDTEESLKEDLLTKCVQQRDFVEEAEKIISQLKLIKGYGVDVKYERNLESLQMWLSESKEKIEELEKEYKIAQSEVIASLQGKALSEADETLKKKIEEYSIKKTKLQEEYRMYSSTLKSLSFEVQDEPEGVHDLAKVVEDLKQESINALGDQGFSILQFLKGEGEFPREISPENMKKTLEILRPFFLKSLKEVE